MSNFSTELSVIKKRLYTDAADIYKQYLGQDIGSLEVFDPLVLMLMNACASEFKIFADEIQTSRSRMLKQLAGMLIPDADEGPLPAHAVVHAPVVESGLITDKTKDEFSYHAPHNRKFTFTPSGNFRLYHGAVTYLASSNTISSVQHINRTVQYHAINKKIPTGILWMGIRVEEASRSTNSLTIYFDIPFDVDKSRLEQLLSTSEWTLNDELMNVDQGLAGASLAEEINPHFVKFHRVRNCEKEVNLFCKNKFLTISLPDGHTLEDYADHFVPQELMEYFDQEELTKNIDEKLFWFKVRFAPSSFLTANRFRELVDNLTCQINCFPVINRKLYSPTFTLGKEFNMFTLLVNNGLFYNIEEVRSSTIGRTYSAPSQGNANFKQDYEEIEFSNLLKKENKAIERDARIYSLRKEGVHRFDKRTSHELIENIMYVIREEALIYNALGKNIITHNLKTIQKAINDITTKLYQKREEDRLEHKVIIAFPPTEKEYVVVKYWSTNGEEANNIPTGESLNVTDSSHGGFDAKAIRFITTTHGGRNALLEKDKIDHFKSLLVAKDKLVTEEDIKIYCLKTAKEEVHLVTVETGFTIGKGKREGFLRKILVNVHLKDSSDQEYKEFLTRKLTVELNENSACYLPIEVRIQ